MEAFQHQATHPECIWGNNSGRVAVVAKVAAAAAAA
eukprot:CAMPEP_0172750656 /NCGR_PEP_ID=MMETSP1074-20121228/150021_1 /TAXON_ID=2916 /ORGANISM="Ceratium fusus, Strain PA161109" /LENGTH=35 /DNA_ID= /DNA_START= /DNA_END= /DNA_ORIENTATION=